jgi:hypothetical protein|tara:strand:- start:1281 stop:1430 length:150 start_codon:yes stop_codon:yes gene_type:complete
MLVTRKYDQPPPPLPSKPVEGREKIKAPEGVQVPLEMLHEPRSVGRLMN